MCSIQELSKILQAALNHDVSARIVNKRYIFAVLPSLVALGILGKNCKKLQPTLAFLGQKDYVTISF